MKQDSKEYMMESRLAGLSPDLHRRFSDVVTAMQNTLSRFHKRFPEFTDHSVLHSMSVLNFCNLLIGPKQVDLLNPDSIYVLMMACYLHDVGMGISMDEYHEFVGKIPAKEYLEKHPRASVADIIRTFHHEFSACFIQRYEDLLDIPSPEHTHAVIQVCRGHRSTDLFDRTQFPNDWTVPGGEQINLPYLSAILRLADEIDVSEARNPAVLYDMESFQDPHEIAYHKRHEAVREVDITSDSIILHILPGEPGIQDMLDSMTLKIEQTLDYCRRAAASSGPFQIMQKQVQTVSAAR